MSRLAQLHRQVPFGRGINGATVLLQELIEKSIDGLGLLGCNQACTDLFFLFDLRLEERSRGPMVGCIFALRLTASRTCLTPGAWRFLW